MIVHYVSFWQLGTGKIQDAEFSTVRQQPGTTATITARLIQPTTKAFTVPFTTRDGTAVAGTDYQSTSGEFSFEIGASEATTTIPILYVASNADNYFYIDLAPGDLYDAPASFKVTIHGLASYEPPAAIGVPLGAENAIIPTGLSQPTYVDASIDYATVDGTATAPNDYTAAVGTLAWVEGTTDTGGRFVLPIKTAILGKSFAVNFSNRRNLLGSVSQTVITIVSNKQAYGYTGADQLVTVPDGITALDTKMWGAGGGSAGISSGGAGGYSDGTIPVVPGEVLRFVVGGGGTRYRTPGATITNRGYGASGGGFTGIQRVSDGSWLLIAGGGGAAGASSVDTNGGAGGGTVGQDGKFYLADANGRGGTQTAGGIGGALNLATVAGKTGSALRGGDGGWKDGTRPTDWAGRYGGGGNYGGGVTSWNGGGGGGGGWFGGGGASTYIDYDHSASGGGGGSGYVHPSVTNGRTLAGNYTSVPMNTDTDRSNAGTAGTPAAPSGYPGRIVVTFLRDAPVWITDPDLGSFDEQAPLSIPLRADASHRDFVMTYAVTAGSLPPNMSMTSGGILSGEPLTAQDNTYSFTVTATDTNGRTAVRTFTMSVRDLGLNPPYWTAPSDLGSVATGTDYSRSLSAQDVEGTTVTHAVAAGSLPPGLSLTQSGTLSGTAPFLRTTTPYNFTLTATDGDAMTTQRNFAMTVTPAPMQFSMTRFSGATAHPYSFSMPGQFLASGNPMPNLQAKRYGLGPFPPDMTGKYYMEITYTTTTNAGISLGGNFHFGFADSKFDFLNMAFGYNGFVPAGTYPTNTISTIVANNYATYASSLKRTYRYIDGTTSNIVTQDVNTNFGLLFDFDNRIMQLRSSNVVLDSLPIPAFPGAFNFVLFAAGASASKSGGSPSGVEQASLNLTMNFGQSAFTYAIPSGYTKFR